MESANCSCGHTQTAVWLYADYPRGSLRKKLSFPCHVPYVRMYMGVPQQEVSFARINGNYKHLLT